MRFSLAVSWAKRFSRRMLPAGRRAEFMSARRASRTSGRRARIRGYDTFFTGMTLTTRGRCFELAFQAGRVHDPIVESVLYQRDESFRAAAGA